MNLELLEKYADFAVRSGANVQPGQTLLITCPVEGAYFARLCAKAAFSAGAKDVVTTYEDEQLARLRMQNADVEVLEDVKPWVLRSRMDYVESEGGAATLRIIARNPELYKGIPAEKVSRANVAASKAGRPFSKLTMANRVAWSIVAIPGPGWTPKVLPNMPPEQAEEELWRAIFSICRVENGNPVEEWAAHVEKLEGNRDWLNGLGLQSIHLKNSLGTNLEVGLADGHLWAGGGDVTDKGVKFLANIPTEEVFTAPHRLRTNGVVKSSMPYVYNGNLIEGMTVHFENGRVTSFSAEKGEEILRQMLEVDEGANHLGEIALVPASSPIRQSGLLFYNTLFDENAACHMAFGAGYPGTVRGGDDMTTEQLVERGVNDSLVHEDIMIGTEDMEITGLTKTGETVQIFSAGEWVR